jgi:hypothetical protein
MAAPQPVVFYIGWNAVSNPVPLPPNEGEWPQCLHSFLSSPPVERCVLKNDVCDGTSQFMGLNDRQPIPLDTLQASGLTQDDINGVIRDVSACVTARASCCWKFRYLGPLCVVIGWLDMTFAQCSCGIVRCCCAEPAIAELKEIQNQTPENTNLKMHDPRSIAVKTFKCCAEQLDLHDSRQHCHRILLHLKQMLVHLRPLP